MLPALNVAISVTAGMVDVSCTRTTAPLSRTVRVGVRPAVIAVATADYLEATLVGPSGLNHPTVHLWRARRARATLVTCSAVTESMLWRTPAKKPGPVT